MIFFIFSNLNMPRTEIITINSTHFKQGNVYEYDLQTGHHFPEGSTVNLHSLFLYNSTYNISSELGNNTMSIEWMDGSVLNLVIPDGYYSVDDLNEYLKNEMFNADMYGTRSNGQELLTYIRFVTNPIQYKNQILIYYVPTSSEASSLSISKPSTASWNFPATRKLPKLTINPNLRKYFGMSTRTIFGNETDQTRNYDYLSDVTPTISDTFAIVVACNLVSNSYNSVNEVIGQIPINKSFGSLLEYINTSGNGKLNIATRNVSKIIVRLFNQNLQALEFKDKDFLCSLLIEIP